MGHWNVTKEDFHDAFAPIVRPATIRLVLSIVLIDYWPICQLDVNNAFLHGLLTEKVYMSQPPRFVDALIFPTNVCRVKKAIYGLQQTPWS